MIGSLDSGTGSKLLFAKAKSRRAAQENMPLVMVRESQLVLRNVIAHRTRDKDGVGATSSDWRLFAQSPLVGEAG